MAAGSAWTASAPSWPRQSAVVDPAEAASSSLELILSVLAVVVALLGWFIADRLYRQQAPAPGAELAASMSGPYNLLVHKYWVDEIYGAPDRQAPAGHSPSSSSNGSSTSPSWAALAWLLAGIASLGGAILQRWQSGNLRSYAAWLAAGAAALLLFVLVPWTTVLANVGIHLNMSGALRR